MNIHDQYFNQQQNDNRYKIINKKSQKIQINKLQKYQVKKLIASGDYICHDKLGNSYLMICHSENGQKGVDQFFIKTKCKFHRNNHNRALLTPFQDIEYHGFIFTIFMIPEHATCILDTPQHHFKSEIFCLSLLFSFINKIVKPLMQIFGDEAIKWIHEQNIWIKQNSVFYVLSERKMKKNKVQSPLQMGAQCNRQYTNELKQRQQKKLLHKLCKILIPYLQIDHQLQSFQSILIDSIINQQFNINQIINILTDKQRRKKFINSRIQLDSQIVTMKEILKQNGEFWRKKSFNTKVENRRGVYRFSHHLEFSQRRKNSQNNRIELSFSNNQPFHAKSRRYSLSPTGMFNFRSLEKKKKNSSIHYQKMPSFYNHQTISMSLSKQLKLTKYVKYSIQNSKIQSLAMRVKQRAYRKFSQNFNNKNSESISIKTEQKKNIINNNNNNNNQSILINQNILLKKSTSTPKYKTIDVCQPISNKQINYNQNKQNYHSIQNNNYFKHKQFNKKLSENPLKNFNIQQSTIEIQQTETQEKSKIPISNIHQNKTQQAKKQQQGITNNIKQIQTSQYILKQLQKSTNETNNNSKEKKSLQKSPQQNIFQSIQQNLDLENIQIIEPKIIQKPKKKQAKIEPVINQDEIQQIILSKHSSKKQSKQSMNKNLIEKQNKDNRIKNKKMLTISKQVNQYIQMINKLGESATKAGKIKHKLEGIQWFTGIYFIYKRFLFERRKIERWLQKKQPNLTRYEQKDPTQWNEWLNGEQKKTLETKIKDQNKNILTSIISMNKKLLKKNLPENLRVYAALENYSSQQSKIVVTEVIKQYDALYDGDKLNDEQLVLHINELFNSLYIIAQLDGKIIEKKQLREIFHKLSEDQISNFSNFIYQLYIKE